VLRCVINSLSRFVHSLSRFIYSLSRFHSLSRFVHSHSCFVHSLLRFHSLSHFVHSLLLTFAFCSLHFAFCSMRQLTFALRQVPKSPLLVFALRVATGRRSSRHPFVLLLDIFFAILRSRSTPFTPALRSSLPFAVYSYSISPSFTATCHSSFYYLSFSPTHRYPQLQVVNYEQQVELQSKRWLKRVVLGTYRSSSWSNGSNGNNESLQTQR